MGSVFIFLDQHHSLTDHVLDFFLYCWRYPDNSDSYPPPVQGLHRNRYDNDTERCGHSDEDDTGGSSGGTSNTGE